MASLAAPPSPAVCAAGDLLDGHYRLVARIGHGGFGDVWRADELLPGGAPFRQVALKLLVPGGGDAVDWAEEAKLLASFRHPSLVTIYAAGILEGAQRFVAMRERRGDPVEPVEERPISECPAVAAGNVPQAGAQSVSAARLVHELDEVRPATKIRSIMPHGKAWSRRSVQARMTWRNLVGRSAPAA